MIGRESRRSVLGIAIVAALAAAVIVPAYAISISGTVRQADFSGLDDAKVTAERVAEYQWTRTSANGDFSAGVGSTNNYDVAAMKGGHDHTTFEDTA